MNATEPLGYLASLLVLATFCMRGMVALRTVAIASNLAFISYASLADIDPVLLLHLLLLPTNVYRLVQAVQGGRHHRRKERDGSQDTPPSERIRLSRAR